MKQSKVKFSIIIPVRVETDYLRETLTQLQKQSFKSFEVLVITDKISKSASPATKRNLGAKMSKGEYLAFIDDDSYPDINWLKNANKQLADAPHLCAVCGPCLTPPGDNIFQKASGLVWSSYLGSGGAGSYRNNISKKRFVDDYPSVNLIVNKIDFNNVGGFNTHHWPGEDTILCLDLVYKLKKQILYHPSIRVFHHRRNVIVPHLQQITRYALHRGNFARVYPQTSFRIGYLVPSMFSVYLLILIFFHPPFAFIPLITYLTLLTVSLISFIAKRYSPVVSLLATITIPITHVYYGILFIIGFCSPKLNFVAHKVDSQNQQYLGG